MATTTTKSWVQKTPGVLGGDPCIRNTRIAVSGLVEWRKLGMSDREILDNIVGLMREDLVVAWDYYRDHEAEIDEIIRLNNEA